MKQQFDDIKKGMVGGLLNSISYWKEEFSEKVDLVRRVNGRSSTFNKFGDSSIPTLCGLCECQLVYETLI